ncbi:MAG TPA: aspartate--tRNA ligase [Oligoflexia bacterium]|nr:aspartate--tRNA ligase [Oligoflexia bacterium]HMP27832.1 aspartate--tRNA ligase [Oligoflexia bacterium]
MREEFLSSRYRTHLCNQLRLKDAGQMVTLSGWIAAKRNHGGVLFVDLRDHYGTTQLVIGGTFIDKVEGLRLESVIQITGKVVSRPENLRNPKLETGEIEVQIETLKILSTAEQVPFQIAEEDNAPESLRLKYRFLELRRAELHKAISLRSQIIAEARKIMHQMGFTEFQTPILTSSSPEGARDFLVPSRVHPGKFFALPQAPQQFKQLTMIAGFDRYFQIAPCFRDEDPRADRSPGEFYQIDMEMSFVEQEDVFAVGEKLFYELFKKFSNFPVTVPPFPKITYADAMLKYGTDKPDLRNPLKIEDLSGIFKKSQFDLFKSTLQAGGAIRGISLDLEEAPPRSFFDRLQEEFKKENIGIGYAIFDGTEAPKGSLAKFLTPPEISYFQDSLEVAKKRIIFVSAGQEQKIAKALGKLRINLGEHFQLTGKERFEFCWIVDFPMYELDPENGQITFCHNPFSMPQGGLKTLNEQDPLSIKAFQYDIVCNGHELSSGAIRNHDPAIMYRAFEIAGYPAEEVRAKFGGMLNAFSYGAPPHGGMAPGIDRIVMLLAGKTAIRDVILFPMAQTVEDLMMGAPSEVPEKALKELSIQVIKKN